MTPKEFYEKYKDYVAEGHYGLDLSEEEIVTVVDKYFQELIKIPGFKFKQIKEKFRSARVYTNLYELGFAQLSRLIEGKIEQEINTYLK